MQLNKLERLAHGGKLTRLLHNPARYTYAMFLSKFLYPLTHKGVLKQAPLFFGGAMQVVLPAATDIFLTGGKTHDSEIRLARFMIAHLSEGHVFVDVGAHFGYFTLLAAQLVGVSGKVLSVEPSIGSHGLLAGNVSGHNNISIHHNAVSDKSETVTFFEFPVLYSEYNALDVDKFKHSDWIKKYNPTEQKVQAVTIDDFVRNNNITPDMIKIDVEGAEVQAINGGSGTWQNMSPLLVVEYLDEGDTSSYTKAAEAMYSHGYSSYMILSDGALEHTNDVLGYMRQRGITSENVVFKKDNK